MKGTLSDGLYHFDGVRAASVDVSSQACQKVQPKVNNSVELAHVLSNTVNLVVSKNVWHSNLAHPSLQVLESIVKRCNLPTKTNEVFKFCEACQFGKSHALPFTNSISRASSKFELVHSNLWGPAPVDFVQGFKFYVLFLDDYSRYSWIYPLKRKGDAVIVFTHFTALVKNQFCRSIKALQSDNGGEYAPIHKMCDTMGI